MLTNNDRHQFTRVQPLPKPVLQCWKLCLLLKFTVVNTMVWW